MRDFYLKKAEDNLPRIQEYTVKPSLESSVLDNGDSMVLDLGNHYVGYFFFKMDKADAYIDAPVRLRIRFCEVERELSDDYNGYNGGLSASWLQEEIINIDYPGLYKLPRRYAARYISITALATPKPVKLSDFGFEAVTSADPDALKPAVIQDAELRRIDEVAVNTLKNCMQRVFEDGPKRDRRLWIGDLRLEALANYYTFDNRELVRRCLYLFAAADKNDCGFIPGFVYDYPAYESGSWYLEDYALLFVCSLCDYLAHTGDTETFLELYDAATNIMDAAHATLDADGLMTTPGDGDVFIDWCEGLEKLTALEGVYLYTLERWCEALYEVGKHEELAKYVDRLAWGKTNSLIKLYDHERHAFINSRDKEQYSVHATVWMILGGVIDRDEGRVALIAALSSPESLKPCTPYMHHYTVEALCRLELFAEAEEYIRRAWGGMVALGADTFFEAYAEGDPDFSPYGDRRVNSMCHAWSCTPAYFIRKYGFGKQPNPCQI